MPHLYAERFAPWCEKARWALDHHGIAYGYTEHVVLLGEVRLRLAARRPAGRVTVPLLIDGDIVWMSSFEIARHAERTGKGAPLFPEGADDAIVTWNERSDAVMVAGRAMLLGRMRASPAALREQLPPLVPRSLRGVLSPVAAMGVRHLVRKYDVRHGDDPHHEDATRAALDLVRAARADGRPFLAGDTFSYADVSMAVALQFVLPVAERYIPLGPATREVWTHHGLAAEYPDLLAWRDALYAERR
jgi:glutathione S-transferase